MAQGKKRVKEILPERTERDKLTAAEALKCLEEFPKRKEQFIAAVRKRKDRGLSA